MVPSEYAAIRDRVQPGDVIAFGGNGYLSLLIRLAGGSHASHAGIVVSAAEGKTEPMLVESTIRIDLDRDDDVPPTFAVQPLPLAACVGKYDGMVWWLPLSPEVRGKLDVSELKKFLKDADGKPFNVPGGLLVVLRDLYQRIRGKDDEPAFRTYFCSELVARALERAKAVAKVDEALVSPTDLCRWRIYQGTYHYLLKDTEPDAKEIQGHNTRQPGST
jgi:hypothetical protein